jgi:hypothetical protein
MAGCQDDNDGSTGKDDGRKCGPNITGHEFRCGVCLKLCPPLLPDNCTPIPVCCECWKQISPTNKLLAISFFKNTRALEGLMNSVNEYLNHRDIVGKANRN